MDKNEVYYKQNLRNILRNKASLELLKLKDLDSRKVAVQTEFISLPKEVIAELENRKLEDKWNL